MHTMRQMDVSAVWRGLNMQQQLIWIAGVFVWWHTPAALLTVALTNFRFLQLDQHVLTYVATTISPAQQLKKRLGPTFVWPIQVAIITTLICGFNTCLLAFVFALILEIHAIGLEDLGNPVPLLGSPTDENMSMLALALREPVASEEFWIALHFMDITTEDTKENSWAVACFKHQDILPSYLSGCLSIIKFYLDPDTPLSRKPPVPLGRSAIRGLAEWLRLSLKFDRTGLLRRADALPKTLKILNEFASQRESPIAPKSDEFEEDRRQLTSLRKEASVALTVLEKAFASAGLSESQPSHPTRPEKIQRVKMEGEL